MISSQVERALLVLGKSGDRVRGEANHRKAVRIDENGALILEDGTGRVVRDYARRCLIAFVFARSSRFLQRSYKTLTFIRSKGAHDQRQNPVIDDEEDILELLRFNLTKERLPGLLRPTGEEASSGTKRLPTLFSST
jgi:hypothetical protein